MYVVRVYIYEYLILETISYNVCIDVDALFCFSPTCNNLTTTVHSYSWIAASQCVMEYGRIVHVIPDAIAANKRSSGKQEKSFKSYYPGTVAGAPRPAGRSLL